jgi:uncharacterized phage infection (PIP) family protein YhgE
LAAANRELVEHFTPRAPAEMVAPTRKAIEKAASDDLQNEFKVGISDIVEALARGQEIRQPSRGRSLTDEQRADNRRAVQEILEEASAGNQFAIAQLRDLQGFLKQAVAGLAKPNELPSSAQRVIDLFERSAAAAAHEVNSNRIKEAEKRQEDNRRRVESEQDALAKQGADIAEKAIQRGLEIEAVLAQLKSGLEDKGLDADGVTSIMEKIRQRLDEAQRGIAGVSRALDARAEELRRQNEREKELVRERQRIEKRLKPNNRRLREMRTL